jgi:magnesium-transporting ATPase (P-type)
VTYVFSDKTGTLTSNEMQLRQIAIEGTSYGHADIRSGCCLRLGLISPSLPGVGPV